MSKLTWHFQAIPSDIADVVRGSGASFVKVLDPPTDNPFPGMKVIGRNTLDDDVGYIWRCDARGYFDRWLPVYQSRPYVHAWEGPNEPDTYPAGNLELINDFYTEWGTFMDRAGFLTVGLSLGEGHPPQGQAYKLAGAVRACRYTGLHEYGAPNVLDGAPWHILRYRSTLAEWRAVDCHPDLLITECGVDGGTIGEPGRGWQKYVSEDAYWRGLCAYDDELAHDPQVLAAFVFTSGPQSGWGSFDVGLDLSRRMAECIGAQPQPQPQPTPTPPILSLYRKLPVRTDVEQFGVRPLGAITLTVVHHTYVTTPAPNQAAEIANIEAIARNDCRRGLPGIPYHYLIGPSGQIYQAWTSTTECWHAAGANHNGLGVAFLKRGGEPTPAAVDAAKWLIAKLNHPVLAHRNVRGSQTACPGEEVVRALGL